jgi:hypothetical protein
VNRTVSVASRPKRVLIKHLIRYWSINFISSLNMSLSFIFLFFILDRDSRLGELASQSSLIMSYNMKV